MFELQENPYWQAFCGFERFLTEGTIHPSTLTKLRKRLGVKFVRDLEAQTYQVLIDKKIIKAKGVLVDATIIPEKIKYPNDVELINDVREWAVKQIKNIGKSVGTKIRTYCRKARQTFLNFSKKKRKSKKVIRKARKQLLQYTARNIRQIESVIEKGQEYGIKGLKELKERLVVGKTILDQQWEMHRTKSNRVKDRIVSFDRPWVRAKVRGKAGKTVEFGSKAAMVYVDGALFLDEIRHESYSEADEIVVKKHLRAYRERFGKKPSSFTADQLYGNKKVRAIMEAEKIRPSFVKLGRKKRNSLCRWAKQKQRERNRIEGAFGNGKEHYQLNAVKYHGTDGAELWTRGSILGMNLKMALARI